MAGKGIRLMKAAREFNIGKDTLVEFLKGKGHEVINKPNALLTEEMHEALMLEFAADKLAKKKAENIDLQVKAPEKKVMEPVKEEAKKPEKVAIKKPTVELKTKGKIDIKPKKKEVEKKPEEPKKEAPKKVEKKKAVEPKKVEETLKVEPPKVAVKVVEKLEPKPEAKAKAKPEAKKEEVPEPPKIENLQKEKLSGPKVIGKVEIKPEAPRRKKRKRIAVKGNSDKKSNRPDKPWKKGDDKKGNSKDQQGVDPAQIEARLKRTMQKLQGGGGKKAPKNIRKKRRLEKERKRDIEEELEYQNQKGGRILKLSEFISVAELASLMEVDVTNVISACMSLGHMVSINQRIDAELIDIVAGEFEYEVEFQDAGESEVEEVIEEDAPEDLQDRPPIVTIMGHVDHGKTSLLDYIREANVVAGEAGGITQHIGAYEVTTASERQITFLDTPGHEAFTAMRARGAKLTDIAVIVIAADDQLMPQTKEAISHAQAAEVPMVFAINKIDKDGANPQKIYEQLSTMNILVEAWGGDFQSQEISAKKGLNIDELLEKIIIQADLLEVKANPDRPGYGTVVEASLDQGRGFVSTILVQNGTIRKGDMLLAGQYYGRIKAMFNERGQERTEAGPSSPVQILGFSGAPQSGEKFRAYADEDEAKRIATQREQIIREQGMRTKKHITLDEIGRRLALGSFKEVNLIIKGDVDGSVEAVSDSLQKLSTDEIVVNIIHKGVGQITESDVTLAAASDAIICGFQVRPSKQANSLAVDEDIEIRFYSVIYDAIDEIRSAMEGMLEPKVERKITANIEVREVFKITGVGKVAGCFVTDGKIKRENKINIIREGIVIYNGELGQLKRFKDDAKEVVAGTECGLSVKNYDNIQVGDVVEAYEEIEIKRTL